MTSIRSTKNVVPERVSSSPIGPHSVPQADRLDRIVDVVRAIFRADSSLSAWNERDRHYHTQAARILGLLDDEAEPTELGRTAANQSDDELAATLANAFANSEVGRAWATWSEVPHLRQVDPNSALDFLTQATELADSTAQRRAAVLRRWHQDLFDGTTTETAPTEDESAFPPEVEAFLDLPADHHELPTRMVNWTEKHAINSYRELVAFDLGDLLGQRNLGRKSVAQTRALIEKLTGMDWSELHDGSPTHDNPEGADTPVENLSWSALAARMPDCVRELALDQVKLPTRMKNYASARGLTTVGEIAVVPLGVLSKEPNLGRKSITGTREAFVELVRNPPSEAIPPSLDDYPSFWDLWKAQLGRLRAIDRMVITLRSGFSGEAKTLVEVGDLMGFTRERARQLESRAINELRFDPWWLKATEARLDSALGAAIVLLEDLQQDPWWTGLVDHDLAFSYFLSRVLEEKLHVVEVDGDRILANVDAAAVDQAWRTLCDQTRDLTFPIEVEFVQSLAANTGASLGPGFDQLFWTRLQAHLHFEESKNQVFGFGNTRATEVTAFLRSCGLPVRMADLQAMFGRFHGFDELLYVDRGLVTLPECVPDFAKWQARLVPLCVAIMRDDERERQWSAVELLDEVRQRARVPEWLGHWYLAGMLKRSEEVVYLGRLRVALPDQDNSEQRIHLEPLLIDLLTNANHPLQLDQLLEQARTHTSFPELTYSMMVKRPPFVQVDEHRVGLIERDVPGGPEAVAAFEEALADELAKRQLGMSPTELAHFVGGISDTHARWTWWMARSIARGDTRFRLSQTGAVGLSDWDDVRVPTRAQLLLACLDEDNGRTSVAKIQGRITELYGRCPSRTQVGLLAAGLGASMRGPQVSRVEVAPAEDSVIDRLEGIPAEAVPILRELLAEDLVPLVDLRDAVRQHVADIKAAARSNEFIDVGEARDLGARCLGLLDLVEGEASQERRALVQAAARYFAISDDAESDFSVGGLDDDLAVVNAVSALSASHSGLRTFDATSDQMNKKSRK
jgi:Sigma-70, region 4